MFRAYGRLGRVSDAMSMGVITGAIVLSIVLGFQSTNTSTQYTIPFFPHPYSPKVTRGTNCLWHLYNIYKDNRRLVSGQIKHYVSPKGL